MVEISIQDSTDPRSCQAGKPSAKDPRFALRHLIDPLKLDECAARGCRMSHGVAEAQKALKLRPLPPTAVAQIPSSIKIHLIYSPRAPTAPCWL